MTEHTNHPSPEGGLPAGSLASGGERRYVRFVALGDSATSGVGDSAEDRPSPGWAGILAEAISEAHDLSYCNVAVPGSTTADVWNEQLPDALGHRAHLAALIVGLNDTMRSSWNPVDVRSHLFMCAAALTSRGARLMTVRFHDHSRVMRLPSPLARLMRARLEELNEILDEMHEIYGGLRVDLSEIPEVYDSRFWSVDRLHPSELGHRALAAHFARLLHHHHDLAFPAPAVDRPEATAGRLDDARWVLTQVAPWLARRARDLGPPLTRAALRGIRLRLRPEAA